MPWNTRCSAMPSPKCKKNPISQLRRLKRMLKKLMILVLWTAVTAAHAADFTGRYTTNWGILELRQDGKKVTGTYVVPAPGEIEGVVDGETLSYKWWQSNGVWGKGHFRFLKDNKKISGTWGTGISGDNGGLWEGDRK
jgi:hypothetical protein